MGQRGEPGKSISPQGGRTEDAAATVAPSGRAPAGEQAAAYEVVRRGMALQGMSDQNLRDAASHAASVGDTATARRAAVELADRQDRAHLTPDAAAASIARRHAANAPAAGGDSIAKHTLAPVSINIFENGAGQLDVGPRGNRTVYDLYRDGGKWYADRLEGPDLGGGLGATTLPDLARKIADRHGVTGTVSIEDERERGKSLTQRFEHTAKAAQAPQGLREPFNPRTATGGTPLPRIEGETDTAYTLRTAVSDESARRILEGYTVGGLRAIARDNRVTVAASASKPQLVAALLQALRQRWHDSQAISRGATRG